MISPHLVRLGVLALLCGCAHTRSAPAVEPSGGAQRVMAAAPACAALAVVLDSLAVGNSGAYPLLPETTTAYGRSNYVPEFFARLKATRGLRDDTWISFLSRNAQPERMCLEMPGRGRPVTTASPLAAWPAIQAAHPKMIGVFVPSGMGVASDGAQVFVLVSVRVSACGATRYIALVDQDIAGRWKISSLVDDGGMADCLGPIGKPPRP